MAAVPGSRAPDRDRKAADDPLAGTARNRTRRHRLRELGAGHDAAAREIAIRFEARGYTTRTWDVVDLFPVGIGRVLRAVYLQQLRHAPGTWGSLLRGLEPSSRRTRTA